jgi:hypothetical protein
MGTIFANRAHAGLLELAGTRKKQQWVFSSPKETALIFFNSPPPPSIISVERFRHGFLTNCLINDIFLIPSLIVEIRVGKGPLKKKQKNTQSRSVALRGIAIFWPIL